MPELANNTANPTTLENKSEPQGQKVAVSPDRNMAHLTSTETEKVSRQDCIKRGEEDQIKS